MSGDQLSPFQAVIDEAAAPPPAVAMFLQLCLLAGLFNDFAVMAALTLGQHMDAPRGLAAVLVGAVLFPFAALPYWLGLAVIYVRNLWAWRLLYAGAAASVLAALVVVGKHGALSLPALCLSIAAGLGVAALVYLGRPAVRGWLHSTAPVFAAVSPGS